MKKYIFPLFIATVASFAVYIFILFWHTEDKSMTQVSSETPQKNPIENLSGKIPIPKPATVPIRQFKAIDKNTTDEVLTDAGIDPDVPKMLNEVPEDTEKIYESLLPENYSETMDDAQVAFGEMESKAVEFEEQVAEEMDDIKAQEALMEDASDSETEELAGSSVSEEESLPRLEPENTDTPIDDQSMQQSSDSEMTESEADLEDSAAVEASPYNAEVSDEEDTGGS